MSSRVMHVICNTNHDHPSPETGPTMSQQRSLVSIQFAQTVASHTVLSAHLVHVRLSSESWSQYVPVQTLRTTSPRGWEWEGLHWPASCSTSSSAGSWAPGMAPATYGAPRSMATRVLCNVQSHCQQTSPAAQPDLHSDTSQGGRGALGSKPHKLPHKLSVEAEGLGALRPRRQGHGVAVGQVAAAQGKLHACTAQRQRS